MGEQEQAAARKNTNDAGGGAECWPAEAEEKYERLDVLGKGSFGMVWMAHRVVEPADRYDDEYVAVKNINIKDEKGKVYAEREICILQELRHPNVIRLIRSYPVQDRIRVVVMQLARGPNVHQLIVKRGALGLPLSRLLSRQLVASVSYLHGRAVLHRDIKPSNVILACNTMGPMDDYDWYRDDAIWSNEEDGEEAVKSGRWKFMLVDFGFARALETDEIRAQAKHLRNSILFEKDKKKQMARLSAKGVPPLATINKNISNKSSNSKNASKNSKNADRNGMAPYKPKTKKLEDVIREEESGQGDQSDDEDDEELLGQLAEQAAKSMRAASYEPTTKEENEIMGAGAETRPRNSFVSAFQSPITFASVASQARMSKASGGHKQKRMSTARRHVRSMSALGTKAYAAPEIRKKLRHKTDADFEKTNAAMTECVADYGMIVDAYSVGWTLRVAMTGVPPNFTISEYMHERDVVVLEGEEEDVMYEQRSWCCFGREAYPLVKIRDPARLPHEATVIITAMTEKNPENRMTVREAQCHPWIAGGPEEDPYEPPIGDYPAKHGDPVVPLHCAHDLNKITEEYHTH